VPANLTGAPNFRNFTNSRDTRCILRYIYIYKHDAPAFYLRREICATTRIYIYIHYGRCRSTVSTIIVDRAISPADQLAFALPPAATHNAVIISRTYTGAYCVARVFVSRFRFVFVVFRYARRPPPIPNIVSIYTRHVPPKEREKYWRGRF